MKDGYWINYDTDKTIKIDEHERWIRRGVNARLLGIPSRVQKRFDEFEEADERDQFLLFVIENAPVMRVRGHGSWWTFEFSSRPVRKPLESIWKFCDDQAGDFTNLVINNYARKDTVELTWGEFKERWDSDRTILREASVGFERTRSMTIVSRFESYLCEGKPAGYGAWIDNKGNVIPVKDLNDHGYVAWNRLNLSKHAKFDKIYDEAFSRGWVRLTWDNPGVLEFQFSARNTTPESRGALKDVIRGYDFDRFVGNSNPRRNDSELDTASRHEAMRFALVRSESFEKACREILKA